MRLSAGYMLPFIKNRPDWGFVCGRISALETKLLPREFFTLVIEMHHTEDVYQHLQGTLIEDYLDPGVPWDDFSAIADECFYDLATSVRAECPSPVPVDLFLIRNDYLNIKSALSGIDSRFLPGTVREQVIGAVLDGDYADLPAPFRDRITGAGIDLGELDESMSDMFVDGAYLRHLLMLADEIDSPLIRACVQESVLGHAVSSLWRVQRQGRDLKQVVDLFLPLGEENPLIMDLAGAPDPAMWPELVGGEIGDVLARALQMPYDDQISTFELKVTNFVLHLSAFARLETSGPERVFAFLMALEAEIQNLKLVVTGKINRINEDILGPRLRYVYG